MPFAGPIINALSAVVSVRHDPDIPDVVTFLHVDPVYRVTVGAISSFFQVACLVAELLELIQS